MKQTIALGMLCLFAAATSVATAQQGSEKKMMADKKMTAPAQTFTATVPGEEQVALDGYCAVCVVAGKGWVKGDPNIASVVDGKRYLFPSQDVKAMFDANPAKFIPAAGGDCAVCLAMGKPNMPGSVKHAANYEGRLYLFPSEGIKQKFLAEPAKFAKADLAHNGDCAVCLAMGKKMPGSEEFTAVHGGKRYLFPSDKERQAFLANPEKFADRG